MRRGRALAPILVLLLAVAAAACGGSSSASKRVDDAGASLGRIHSGELHLRVQLQAGPAGAATAGFTMDGPFDLRAGDGGLPLADLTQADLGAGGATTRFVADGRAAYVVRGDVGYRLTDDQVASIRTASSASTSDSGFTGLDLGSWVVEPANQPPTTLEGEAVERTTGRADPVAAINAIVTVAGQLGGDGSALTISDADAGHVRDATRSSSFEVLAGADDHLLRSLRATFEFAVPTGGAAGSSALLDQLRKLGQLSMVIELQVRRPNTGVTVTAPGNVKPIADLPAG